MKKIFAFGAACCSLVFVGWSADGVWTSAVDGAWSSTAKWSAGTVASGAGSAAYLSSVPGPVQITNDVAGLKLQGAAFYGGAYRLYGQPLTFEGATAAPNGLSVSNGAQTVETILNLNRNIDIAVEGGASLITTGLLDNLGSFNIVKKGLGEWVFRGGMNETNATALFDVIGGTLRVTSGATLSKRGGNREQFRVGYSGKPGRVVVEGGAALNLAGFVLGHDTAAATGYMLIDGGTLTANMTGTDNPVLVGRMATGTLCVSNSSTVTMTDWFNLGVFSQGTLLLGGNSTMTVGRFSLGWHTQESASFVGPGVAVIGSGTLSALNQFVWRSSAAPSRTNLMTVGNGTAGSAVLRVPATMRTASTAGGARLTLDGGELEMIGLRALAPGVSLTNYLFGLEQLWIGRAGATLDTATNTVTITQAVERDPSVRYDGGITKGGAGMLTLSGACAYNGPTLVAQGTLRMSGAMPAGVAVVAPGAKLSFVDGQYRAFTPSALTAGQGGESVFELEVGSGGAADSLVLAAGSRVGNVVFHLVGLGGLGPYWFPGDYVVASYSGSDPDIGGWHAVAPLGLAATFEVQSAQKRVVLHVAGVDIGYSVWISPGGGAWGEAGNWNIPPANDPVTAVRFGGAVGSAAAVTLGAPVTVGSMTFATPYSCTLSGSGITFGAAGAGGMIQVDQGSHALLSALSLPEALAVEAQPGATVLVGNGATGSGSVTVSGGGTLAITNGAAFDVPLTIDGATLGAPDSTTIDTSLTAGAGGATLNPSYGKTLTVSGAISGSGALAKDGSNIVVLSGPDTGTGERIVKNGTLETSSLLGGGEWVIGEGRLRYTGAPVVVDRGFTIRTSNAKLAATLDTDTDITFNGNVKADRGVFIKAGSGTVTFSASGVNALGTGEGSDNYSSVMNFGPYGESPTLGLRIFNVVNGKVVLGVPGQTNLMNQTIIIGGQSTSAAGAETAGHLEINEGFLQTGFITIGRGNGTPLTAPAPLESSVTINGGRVQCSGVWMAANLNDMTTYRVNARPRFEMNGGTLIGSQLFCGNDTCSIYPKLHFNGGFASFTGVAVDDVRLAYAAGVTSETFVAGGTLAISNTTIRLAENFSTARGVLRLNGGRVITRGINRQGSGVGMLYLNGGVLQPCQNMTLTNLSSAVVQSGGFVADVPAGLTLALRQTLSHDGVLGGSPDGGLMKLGSGTLAVDFDQTFTGPTVVSAGVLRVSGNLAVTNLTLAGGATLSLTDGVERVFAPSVFMAGDVGGAAFVELDVAAEGGAHDVLALPSGVGGKLTLRLFRTGTAVRFISPGRYPLITFSGAAPDTSDWFVEGLETVAAFEREGAIVYVRIGAGSGGVTTSVWTNAAGGAWNDAGNWSAAPANDASANVVFGGAISAPSSITTGSGATLGYLVADSAYSYTWSGGALTLGSAGSNATVHVAQGSHIVEADLAVPSGATVVIDPGSSLAVYGTVSGTGSLTVAGGGTVAFTNGPALDVPVTVNGATVSLPLSTVVDAPVTLGAAGAVFAPASGQLVEVTSDITGPGGLTKSGASVLALSGGTAFDGELWVRNGTVAMTNVPAAALSVGEGTFRYAGSDADFTRGYKLRTTVSTQAATFYSDADITFTGQVKAESGAFIKLGGGTFTYAYVGENILSAGDNSGSGSTYLDIHPYGDTPTQGYRSFNVFNGTVILGAEGQTNRFSQAIIIGGQSTTNEEAETAGHMVINGGVNVFQDFITVGRGNGTATTAPTGVVSTLTINGGESAATGFWMAAMLSNQTTLTARPRFALNGGALNTLSFRCGGSGGAPRPLIEINGGVLTVGPNEPMMLAYSAGCETELSINGGTVVLTNQALRLAEDYATAKGLLSLNGGRLVAQNLTRNGTNGTGCVSFNGGVFEPRASTSMDTRLALTNRAGGAVFDVPDGIAYTMGATLNHDETLGVTPDGGLLKLGAGKLVLAGTQSYTGMTLVSNGTLEVSGALPADAGVVVAPGGALVLTAPTGGAVALGSLSLGGGSGDEAVVSLTADPARFLSGGALVVGGDLFLGKTAVTVSPRGISMAEITNGTYVVMSCSGTISGSAADLRVANGVFGKGYTFGVSGSDVLLTIAMATSHAEIWSSETGGEWTDAGNWITPPDAGAPGMRIGFLQTITAPATVNLDASVTAGTLFLNNANSYTISGGGSLTFDETNGVPLIAVEQGTQTVAVAAVLADNTTAVVSNNAAFQVTGAVSGGGKLSKTGPGRLAVSGNNTYMGGTEVLAGSLDVEGDSPLGTGTLIFNGGSLASSGAAAATVANDVTSLTHVTIDTVKPLTLSGDWTSAAHTLLAKTGTNSLTFAGAVQPSSGLSERLALNNGSVRFASGANALFLSSSIRNAIDFSTPTSDLVTRRLEVEPGAAVSARCLYMGFGLTNTLSVSGGSLLLTGYYDSGSGYTDAQVGVGKNSGTVVNRYELSGGSVYSADSAWWLLGAFNTAVSLMTVSGSAVSLGQLSFGNRDLTNSLGDSCATDVSVNSGLLEARQRLNWMGDANGTRVNTVWLNGGRLRLPATYSSNENKINQSRLVFNGGLLETPGGGTSAENPTNYLAGLKQAYVGSGGAIVDTQGRTVTLAQRLMTLADEVDGGIVKRGLGVLTLSKPPCVAGWFDVQAGTLGLRPETGIVYPDDPMLRLSFESGVQTDESSYARNVGTMKGNTNNLNLVAGKNGSYALALNSLNALYADTASDTANIDTYTVSAWVYKTTFTGTNPSLTFFGTLDDYVATAHEFLLRTYSGSFRMLATGPDNKGFGQRIVEVTNAVPLNAWVMLTLVVNGRNGISMYVNGEKRTMRSSETGEGGPWTSSTDYGLGKTWYLTGRTTGRLCAIGTTTTSDTDYFNGRLDDVTLYRRALSPAEVAVLYAANNPYAKRVRVAAGAALDLSGATQAVEVLSGEGIVNNGTASVTTELSPGDWAETSAGALLTASNLALGTNVTYRCDWTPEDNDRVDVWGTLTVNGAGTIDLGLTSPSQMPGAPRFKSFPVMYYTDIDGAANFSLWTVTGVGRAANATVTAADGVVSVALEVFSGTLIRLK